MSQASPSRANFDDYVQELRNTSDTPFNLLQSPTPPPSAKPHLSHGAGVTAAKSPARKLSRPASSYVAVPPPLAASIRHPAVSQTTSQQQSATAGRRTNPSQELPMAGRSSGLPDPKSRQQTRGGVNAGSMESRPPRSSRSRMSTPRVGSQSRPGTGASRLFIGQAPPKNAMPQTARITPRDQTARIAPRAPGSARGSRSGSVTARTPGTEGRKRTAPRTDMGAVIQGYEERMGSRERKNRAPYWNEVNAAQSYAQVRGGGGSNMVELSEVSSPVRTRHVRDVDLPPPTPVAPFQKDPLVAAESSNHFQPMDGSNPWGLHKDGQHESTTHKLARMNDNELQQTLWRAPAGEIGDVVMDGVDITNAKNKPLQLFPGALALTRAARLQMELIGAVVASKHRGFVRSLLAQCSDSKCKLTRDQLRRAIKMLNVDPHEEILDALMGGKRYANDKDIAVLIEGDMSSKDYEAPLGDPHLNTPFGVAQDAVKGIEETHDKLSTKWGSLEQAWTLMDVDGSGQLSYDEFKAAVIKACPVNLSDHELQLLFAEVDKDKSGQVCYGEFQSEFGRGSIFVPEFLKPRSLRQSRGGPIWQWDVLNQGSNSKRPFEITDKHGHKRYHCKASHSYKLPKAFTEDAIAKRIHLCRDEMEKIERVQQKQSDQEIADHEAGIRAGKGLSAPPPRSRCESRAQEVNRPRSCRPPWATTPMMSETYKFRINGTVPLT